MEGVEPPEEAHHWKLFQDSCRYRGLNAALKQLPEAVREKYVEAIHSPDIKVWRPVDIWSFWPEVLNRSGLLLEDNEGEKGQMV